jgi:hypothetical protein
MNVIHNESKFVKKDDLEYYLNNGWILGVKYKG